MAKNKSRLKKISFFVISTALSLIITIIGGEIICLIGYQWKKNLSNHKPLDYGDVCWNDGMRITGYLRPNFNNLVIDGYGKLVKWKNNSLGFRYDREISIQPVEGVCRILSLGDSFNVGYRIDQEAVFPRLLEKYFNNKKDNKQYEVLPANVDEPNFGLLYLSNFGLKLNPNVVILGITLGNDVSQNYVSARENCGYVLNSTTLTEEAFFSPCMQYFVNGEIPGIPQECLAGEQDKVQNKDTAKISILGISMLYRTIYNIFKKYQGEPSLICTQQHKPCIYDICAGFGIFIKNFPREIADSYSLLFDTLYGYKKLSERYNFKLIVIIFPQRFQVQKEDWMATADAYNLKDDSFHLMMPNDLILGFCREEKITCIDPTLDMASFYSKKIKSLYFPGGDMHLNALGNKVVYEAIKDKIYQIITDG